MKSLLPVVGGTHELKHREIRSAIRKGSGHKQWKFKEVWHDHAASLLVIHLVVEHDQDAQAIDQAVMLDVHDREHERRKS